MVVKNEDAGEADMVDDISGETISTIELEYGKVT